MNQSDIAALAKGLGPVVRDFVAAATAPLIKRIDELEAQIDGVRSVDHAAQIAEAVEAAVAGIPLPADGKDGEPGRDGLDGKDAPPVSPEEIAEAVERYLTDNPPAPGKDGRDGVDGKDGVGLADAVIDRNGGLVLTMTDGRTKELGVVVGKDGENGSDGEPGKNGADGLGFDDMDLVVADDGVALKFERGDQVKAFALPVVIDRGVFKEGGAYRKGNGVTWGGQFWIAQKDEPEGKPDASDDWRLAVKKGRDAPRREGV